MEDFVGFMNSDGEIVHTPDEFLDVFQEHFQKHGNTPETREHLKQHLLLLNDDSDYVDSAIAWGIKNFELADEESKSANAEPVS